MRALIFLALTLLSPATGTAQDAQAIIGRAARVYRSLASLQADFVQLIDNPMIDSAESRGTLVQAGPAKLAMRFSDPPGEAIVIDGEHVWVYTPSTVPDQVVRFPFPAGARCTDITCWPGCSTGPPSATIQHISKASGSTAVPRTLFS